MSTKIRPELQIKPGSQSQVLTTVDGKATWADAQMPDISNITNLESQLGTKADKVDTYTKEQVDQKVSDLVGSAPETLNTLQEIAQALNNDENAYTSLSNALRQYIDEKTTGLTDMVEMSTFRSNVIGAFQDLAQLVSTDFGEVVNYLRPLPNDTKYTVSSPINAGSRIEELAIEYPSGIDVGVDVYLNGLLQDKGSDYNIDVDVITFYNVLVAGDVIVVKYRPRHFIDASVASAIGNTSSFSTSRLTS